MLRLITDGRIAPEEAVRAYHGVLQAKGIPPHRPLDKDLELTDPAMSYRGSSSRSTVSVPRPAPVRSQPETPPEVREAGPRSTAIPVDWPRRGDGSPDFAVMTSAQRQAYDEARLKRRFG
jgi:hypothetical protein